MGDYSFYVYMSLGLCLIGVVALGLSSYRAYRLALEKHRV